MTNRILTLLLLLTISITAYGQGAGTAASIYRSSFANLGTPVDGSVRYCTDCTPNTTPATSGGTGAFVDRVNGVWAARASAASGGGTVTTSGSPASPQLAKFSSATAITTATATDVSTPSQCADAGATDTYACNLAPAVASYVVGTKLRFFANTANTGAATVNFNTVGALTIVKMAGGITTALATGDINAGQWVEGTIATGSNFQMTSQIGGAAGITNSAPANTVPKSDGTNLVSSRITDDGTDINITTRVGFIGDDAGSFNGTEVYVNDIQQRVLIAANNANQDFSQINAGAGQVTIRASDNTGKELGLDANGNLNTLTLGDFNGFTNSTKVTINDATKTITLTADATTGVVNLNASALNFNSHSIGATLAVPVSNTVLAQATGTVYSSPGYVGTPLAAATEGAVSWPCPRAGVIKNLFVRTGTTAKTNSPTTTVTIRKNGVDTTVTLTLTETTSTTSSDTTHSFTVAQGDLITVSFAVAGAAAVSTSIAGISFELQ